MLVVPRAGAPVQGGDLVRQLGTQMRREHVGKEVVIPVPVARVIEWDDKEVPPVERLQPRGALGLARNGIAQRAVQAVENGGLE
jgi:hypothetical protein